MENDENISLKTGEVFEVKLQRSAGTGLQLRHRCEDESIVQVRRKEQVPADAAETRPAKLGGPILAHYIIEALKEGETKVTFYETRPWDKNFKEIIQKQISVKVS